MPNGATHWLTVKQASEQSGFSIQYVRRLCREGKVRSERVANALLIDPESLKAYMREMKSLGDQKHTPKAFRE